MKSLVGLYESLLADAGRKTGADLRKDLQTIQRRVELEGDSFLTITLPSFCSAFERALEEGRLQSHMFPAFKKRKRHAAVPAFLQGLLLEVFDTEGQLLAKPRTDCIQAIRQICLFCKKVRRPCSRERERAAVRNYVSCEEEISSPLEGQFFRYYLKVAEILLEDIMPGLLDASASIMPKHGPGATQEHVAGNGKWGSLAQTWHSRLERAGLNRAGTVYPEYPMQPILGGMDAYSSLTAYKAQKRWQEDSAFWKNPEARLLAPGDEPPVRVVFVPKTLKTPRVIAVEPVCMQFMQQGLFRFLVERIEHSRLMGGHVNFADQSINQSLAKLGSTLGHLATLDLSEASDRVSFEHAEALFRSKPDFWRKIEACRSRRAKLPNDQEIDLKKFASMGSALCFPVEAMVFFTIIIAHRLLSRGLFPDKTNVYSLGRDVYVYGDDLIVPSDEAPGICDSLESFGLKVNRRKSFWAGKFRESCGEDVYDGYRVTPVYLRRDVPRDARDAQAIVASVATANQLARLGYWATANALKDALECLLGPLPQVCDSSQLLEEVDTIGKPLAASPVIGFWWGGNATPRRRWNHSLQRYEYLCLVPVDKYDDDPLEGYEALAKCFRLVRGSEPDLAAQFSAPDTEHLEYSVRRYALGLKRSWVPGPIGPGTGVPLSHRALPTWPTRVMTHA